MALAGRSVFARRAAECRVQVREWERSAAHWLARRSGTSLGHAAASLETAERLDELPATDAAFRAGRLSETQVREIASVAAAQPEVERRLLATAETDTVQGLRQACRKVAASHPGRDEMARQRAVHAGRYLKHSENRGRVGDGGGRFGSGRGVG